MNRPDFEALYKQCFRRYQELLNDLEDKLKHYANDDCYIASDLVQELATLHDQHIAHDWRTNG